MKLRHIIIIIITIGLIILSFKFIIDFFKKKRLIINKREKINTQTKEAFEIHSENIKSLNEKYMALYEEFKRYKEASEKARAEMEKYINEIIEYSNEIIKYDELFEEKLQLWCELLSDPNNSVEVKQKIEEYLKFDINIKRKFLSEQEQKHIKQLQNIEKNFGLDL